MYKVGDLFVLKEGGRALKVKKVLPMMVLRLEPFELSKI